jgi:transposase-like protein
MSSKLLAFISESENACCPYGYLVLHADLTIRKHARTVGVAKETLRLWRRAAADGTYSCTRGPHCLCKSEVISTEAPLRWSGREG